MKLTNPSRTAHHDNDSFPTSQLFVLALVRLAEPIALTSIFPYAWPLVKSYNFGDPSDASFYAGILISAFALAEAVTSFFWGSLSDRIGRKPVLLLGCTGTIASLLVLGFATNFWVALAGRIIGGILNGSVSIIFTIVAELVKKPEHEPKAYAVLPFVWSAGTIIGPALGGTFANPAVGFPALFSKHGLFGHFPYLLPNLICAVLVFISMTVGYFYLQETHPDLIAPPDYMPQMEEHDRTPLITAAGANAMPEVDLRTESYGTFNEVDLHEEEHWRVHADGSPMAPEFDEKTTTLTAFTWRVWMIIVALGIFTYHAMSYDHLLPIYLQDDRAQEMISITSADSLFSTPGGLGMTTKSVGLIMAVNGIIALFIQGIIFPLVVDWLGVWNTFFVVTVLHPIAYFIVPFLALLPDNLLYLGIYVCLAIHQLFSILVYPVILILLKQASPAPSALGKINGLGASVGAATRTLGPPVAGYLYGVGTDIGFTGLAWWGTGVVALIGAFQLWFVPRDKSNNVPTVRSLAPCMAKALPTEDNTKVVRVEVTDVEGA